MSAASVVMSSPPRPIDPDPTSICSSSPSLPSLDEIFTKDGTKKLPLCTGAHAGLAAINVRTSFTSAVNVLREAPEIDIDTEKITNSPPRRFETVKMRRRALTPGDSPNNRRPKQAAFGTGSLSPKDKPWQKFKSKSPTLNNEQSMPPEEPKNPTSKRVPRTVTGRASKHFTTGGDILLPENDLKGENSTVHMQEPLDGTILHTNLEPAMVRRGEWTPPRAIAPIIIDSDLDARELFSSAEKVPVSKEVFQTLFDQYGRQDTDSPLEKLPQPQTELLRKRKRIDLILTGKEEENQQPPEQSPSKNPQRPQGQKKKKDPKAPAPKKKSKTITGLATAPFAAREAIELDVTGPSTKESMLTYFDSDGTVKALVEHQAAVMSQRKSDGKETKRPLKTKRKKPGTAAHPILLSPNSALKQSSNQDFVFGTSSQLVREESPTMLENLQTAIRASNTVDSDPFGDDMCQRLWHAGARDEDGELLEMEVVDLRQNSTLDPGPVGAVLPEGRSFVDIDDILDSPAPAAPVSTAPIESLPSNSPFFQSQGTSKHGPSLEPSGISNSESHPKITDEIPPNYALFTDAQLATQITSYGFKPVKKRTAMIALLDQCWTSRHQGTPAAQLQPFSTSARSPSPPSKGSAPKSTNKAATEPRRRGRPPKNSATTDSNVPPATSNVLSPKQSRGRLKKDETAVVSTAQPSTSALSSKRSRGRPRKSSSASVEIADSETSTPSPVSSPDGVFSSPPPLDLTTSDEADMSLTLSPTDQQADLFKHITKAVTSAPRSQDPLKPSWYEKMLLYDPIVLEELASWLNGGELTRVGYDGEVSPFDVKKWCESKSVICLWRQNLNGKERKRY
ncbi:hypothetical protein F5Y19DRAFT_302999 [Xylariaceae sp. FL1651]|nr:hypothetical protein F5Y19DRAFT_302999 [Xylariaceae sp. FL1651]